MKKILLPVLTALAFNLAVCAQGRTGSDENDTAKYTIVAEAVDLGLSVKWASFNVGASKPEEYGGYFGWADPAGEKTSTSNVDYPSTNPPSNICGTEYDAAHVHWGGLWRLPTREEQEELVNHANWKKTKLNNVDGYRVTGPNGNTIFLPAGGGRIGTTIHYRVSGADFWSGTLSVNTEEAYYMWFYGGRQAVEDLPRHYGFSIRPVMEYGNDHITVDDTVSAILNHSAFEGFGRYLMPWDNHNRNYNIPITQVASLMPYHRNVVPQVVADSVNYMIDEVSQGKTIFYDFYTRQDKNNELSKNNAGLFFFRGNPGAPFVLLIPGGGFSYVGSLHEGFPLAVEIAKKGYNAFVIKYRPSRQNVTLDTVAALSYIFDHSSSLEVNTNDYSLWGLSAGGQAVSDISLRGTAAYGGADLPKPCTGVYLYALQPILSKNDPAAFTAIGESDRIGSVELLENQIKTSQAAGADIEYHLFPNTGHGFGLGTGTNAEGWLDNAVRHWERRMKKP